MKLKLVLLLVLLAGHQAEASIAGSIADSLLNGIKNAAIGAGNFVLNLAKVSPATCRL